MVNIAERSDYDNAAYSISFEYGRQKNYEKGWFFTPQAQITLGLSLIHI